MCRLVGVVASQITEFGLVLKEAPRSLASLSRQHPDGWGIAAHGGDDGSGAFSVPQGDSIPPSHAEGCRREGGWRVHKGTRRAAECHRFMSVASRSAGTVLIAHIRQKTVGPTRIENTHPFLQNGWVFAHNGTIQDQTWIRAETSPARMAAIRGETDSEVLFAHLLSRLDAAGVSSVESPTARERATNVIAQAAHELRARKVGAFNFLLSDGRSCFVHRFGRTLFILERTRERSPAGGHATTWTPRRHAVLVASERLTDEGWRELPEGSFLRIDREPTPAVAWYEGPERAAS